MTPADAYIWLRQHHIETSILGSVGGVIAWDQRTCIPERGHPHRAEQLATLAKIIHERAIDPRVEEHLDILEGTELISDPSSDAAINVRTWKRIYRRSSRIPTSLAESLARATANAETVWERAREDSDWKTFKPVLAQVFDLLHEKASALGYKDEPYDALIEDYEPGETAASLEPIFETLRVELTELLKRIEASEKKPNRELLLGPFPLAQQEAFCVDVAGKLGFDFRAGRLDTTTHPFSTGLGPGDVRITTRYDEAYLPMALFGTIHEAGHAIYEQGLPAQHWGTPRGEAVSLGFHESQSRLWENLVGRSAGMWRYLFPLAQKQFAALRNTTEKELVFAINAVEPSLIRVEADEVTYNLHVLIRFELELALLRGDLSIDDLPDAWCQKMKAYLGLEPPDMASGVMQDVHWSAGLVGYFPTYTLGNIYAAQLFKKAEASLGNLEEQFAEGNFAPLLDWLHEHVHGLGSTFEPRDLIAEVTGEDRDPSILLRSLEDKYSALYDL